MKNANFFSISEGDCVLFNPTMKYKKTKIVQAGVVPAY